MEPCPKCKRHTLQFNSYLNIAECLSLDCRWMWCVRDEKDYRKRFDIYDNRGRCTPNWDNNFRGE